MAPLDRGGGIGRDLMALGSVVDHPGPALWHLKLAGMDDGPATARLTDGWLRMEARAHATTTDAGELLAVNAGLPWPARLAVDPSNGCLLLRADIVLSDDRVTSRRIQETAVGFAAATEALRARRPRPAPPPEMPLPDEGGPLAASIADDGWSVTPRDGYLEVGLESGVTDARALVSRIPEDGVRASVALTRRTSGTTGTGVALWLLASTSGLRAVRPALRTTRSGPTVVLETGFESPPDEMELLEAVAALSVGLRHTACEARALLDMDMATHYLDRWARLSPTLSHPRGGSSTSTRRRRRRT